MNPEKEYLSLNSNYFKLMMIKRVIFIVVAAIISILFYFFNDNIGGMGLSLFLSVLGVIALFGIISLLMVKPIFKRKMYRLDNRSLSYKKGIVIFSKITVPFSRIQHIEIDEGPLERKLGLASISIYTAGDSGKDLKINGLSKEKANEIKEFIATYIKNE